jgi:hypothetical protein
VDLKSAQIRSLRIRGSLAEMPAKRTCFVNSTKKEYIIIGKYTPSDIRLYLLKLESEYNWDLRLDNIYIMHSECELGYKMLNW